MPKKPASATGGESSAATAAKRGKILANFPVLASYLTDLAYEDGGGAREPSWLSYRAGAGVWVVTLKDPTEARQVRVMVETPDQGYAALEALLASDTCPWEPDRWAEERRSKKKR